MKKLLFICLVLSACKKEVKPNDVTIQVRDAITNAPISGATVHLTKCENPIDIFCWFNSEIPFISNTTDAGGACGFSDQDFNKALSIVVSKTNYWTTSVNRGAVRTIYLRPR